ncbi:Protein involved in Snf1 protein kinase complex assembly [Phaffia rhodozyma]|uniref:Protein involved in Snf1 protein kinase complex assembly n=1 Tax=Phaffia rhodozyma TaxID=264483 RepID=A0A0F7SS33_PHARH|nr:Protein involved in Snf1 protein kinase complex assembly [Phaffia rhodozyma]
MGNGQSSPNPHHTPREHKPSSSHHHLSRSSSPAASNSANNRRKKSLELPDLANLTLTNVNGTAGSSPSSPYAPEALGKDCQKSSLKTGNARNVPGSAKPVDNLGLKKRPSPLAPSLVTSPLSPTSPKSSSINAVHNLYFSSSNPTSSSSSANNTNTSSPTHVDNVLGSRGVGAPREPVPIPKTPQTPNAGLPNYSRSYTPNQRTESDPPDRPPSTARGDHLKQAKTARISDSLPEEHPPLSTSPASSKHSKRDPSGTGEDEVYVRSSLPLGGAASSPGPHVDGTEVASMGLGLIGADAKSQSVERGFGSKKTATRQVEDPKQAEKEVFVNVKEEGVPTIINWTGGGKEVFVCGTFAKNWKERIRMNKSTHDFTLVLNLPPGPHRLKFIVDESWKCSDDLATATDADGSLVNYIEVEQESSKDGKGWSSEWEGAAEDNDDDPDQWTTEIPELLTQTQAAEEAHLAYIANLPPANRQPGSAALANPPGLPYPPGLPRHLEKVILNNPPKDGGQGGSGGPTEESGARGRGAKSGNNSIAACWTAIPDDNSILPIPNHVVLNHLTASAIRNGTLAVGTTTRYKRKYISTLLYKPVEIRD